MIGRVLTAGFFPTRFPSEQWPCGRVRGSGVAAGVFPDESRALDPSES